MVLRVRKDHHNTLLFGTVAYYSDRARGPLYVIQNKGPTFYISTNSGLFDSFSLSSLQFQKYHWHCITCIVLVHHIHSYPKNPTVFLCFLVFLQLRPYQFDMYFVHLPYWVCLSLWINEIGLILRDFTI